MCILVCVCVCLCPGVCVCVHSPSSPPSLIIVDHLLCFRKLFFTFLYIDFFFFLHFSENLKIFFPFDKNTRKNSSRYLCIIITKHSMWKEQVLLRTAEETTAPPKGTGGPMCSRMRIFTRRRLLHLSGGGGVRVRLETHN